jgi:multiple sugar transport system ATP-binding protein
VHYQGDVPAQGKPVKVGIRPDFFNDKEFFGENDSTFNFADTTIDLVEPMGFDKEVLFKLGDENVKARLDLRSEVTRGEKMDLLVDLSRVLLFDIESEERI